MVVVVVVAVAVGVCHMFKVHFFGILASTSRPFSFFLLIVIYFSLPPGVSSIQGVVSWVVVFIDVRRMFHATKEKRQYHVTKLFPFLTVMNPPKL